jgi:hypothetical protein
MIFNCKKRGADDELSFSKKGEKELVLNFSLLF